MSPVPIWLFLITILELGVTQHTIRQPCMSRGQFVIWRQVQSGIGLPVVRKMIKYCHIKQVSIKVLTFAVNVDLNDPSSLATVVSLVVAF